MISLDEFYKEIDAWKEDAIANRYDLAFLKIYIKYEVFLSELLMLYALGQKSPKGFKPKRRLCFKNEEHIRKVFSLGRRYVDFLGLINKQKVYSLLFSTRTDPFTCIFEDSVYPIELGKMKYLRNYIAHESREAKELYVSKVLKPSGVSLFEEPNDFLQRVKYKIRKSYYSYWISILEETILVLIDPSEYIK